MPHNVKLSSRSNDILLNWAKMKAIETGTCYLVALTDFHIALLLTVLRYAEWKTRWEEAPNDFSEVTYAVAELENCLMSGCNVQDLIDSLDAGFAQLHTDMEALTTQVSAVATNQATGEDLEDDLANLWRQVEQVTVILGGAIAEAPIPL